MEQELTLATREIMWNIPASFKIAMYALLALSSIIFIKGLLDKINFVTSGTGIKGLKKVLPEKLNWGEFLRTTLLTGKVPRSKDVAIFHGLIFFGFFILWIATDLVAIHYDTPFKIFEGNIYKVVSFAADFAGLAVLIGLILAFKRRYITKPDYLSSTNPKRELFMYSMLASLVIIGFLIEGVRILGTDMPIGEKTWAPLGWALASLFKSFGISNAVWSNIYKGMWLYHMINTMVFIASLTHTKFFHIIALPFQALITPKRRGAVLNPMDFENEEAETFGLGKLSELTLKNKIDLISCVECGRCTNVCPAHNAGKPLNPKLIITKVRDLAESTHKVGESDAEIWSETTPLFTASELDSCTTCGACMEECPANIEHVNLIMEAKRYKTLTLGEVPPSAADAINKIKVNGNPWGISQDDRFKWADGLDVPVIQPDKKVSYLYYVGCAGSYDDKNQKVARDVVKLLKKAGVDFAVMGKTEKCNGDPIRRIGDEYTFYEVALENIAMLNQYKFDKIITHCPHCLHTVGKEYTKFENGTFETVHHTEVLNDLIKNGLLVPEKKNTDEMTFHDPCYLGRHHGEYNAPREILESVGVKIKEMDQNKDKAMCCGMGGGNMWYEVHEGEELAVKRLEHVAETKPEILATACSYCMINFGSSKSEKTGTENIEIEDVAQILAKSVFPEGTTKEPAES